MKHVAGVLNAMWSDMFIGSVMLTKDGADLKDEH